MTGALADHRRRQSNHIVSAALVIAALAAGCGDTGGGKPLDVATSPRIEIVGTEMAFTPDTVAVLAGNVEVIFTNEGQVYHDLRIGEVPFIAEAASGERDEASVFLEPGTYELFCSIPGHSEAGMVGVLEVREP
ncbi:MAG: cupredoxin domain-containing protein [Microthrixaceae bacterium]